MDARSRGVLLDAWDRLVDSSVNYRIAMVADLVAPAAWLVYATRRFSGSLLSAVALAFIGFFCFGWLEYAVHRWVLHGPLLVLRRSHARHHAEPMALYSAPLFVMMSASVVIWGLLDLVLFPPAAAFLVCGLYAGYDYFAVLHHLEHHRGRTLSRVGYLHGLERFHDRHHHRPSVNFGITSTIWDRLLGTFEPKSQRKERL